MYMPTKIFIYFKVVHKLSFLNQLSSVCFLYLVNRTEAQKDIHRASLMWSPLKEDEQKQKEGIEYTAIL